MNTRRLAVLAVCVLGLTSSASPAEASGKRGDKAGASEKASDAAPATGGDQLDQILSLPTNSAPTESIEKSSSESSTAVSEPKSADRPTSDSASSSQQDSSSKPSAASADENKVPVGNITGPGNAIPAFVQQTPKTDFQAIADPESKLLKGNVSDTTSLNPLLKPILPEMDCVGFAARVSEAGVKFLRAQIGKGNGYLTDGGAWSKMGGDYPVMTSVFDGDSCEKQGIQSGDVIIELNGVSTFRLPDESINNLFAAYDGDLRNHYTLKRGSQVFRVVTQCTWHSFGSGSSEEKLWKDTVRKFAKQL